MTEGRRREYRAALSSSDFSFSGVRPHAGQGERVELAYIARNGHQVVGGYAAYEQFAVAVVHLAAWRVLHLFPQHVVLGGPFV